MAEFEEHQGQPLVLVTGCTEFIGSWCVKYAFEYGFRVRGTTRNLSSNRVQELKEKFPRLDVVFGDVHRDKGWSEAFEDVNFLLHAASMPPGKDINASEVATVRILNAAFDAHIESIVVTSSILALTEGHFFDFLDGCIFTHKEWSDVHNLNETSPAYRKTIAEKKVWDVAQTAPDIRICTVVVGDVVGPLLLDKRDTNLAYKLFYGPIKNYTVCPVDIRDVMELHMQGLVNETTDRRRLIAVAETGFIKKYAVAIHKEFKQYGYAFPPTRSSCCLKFSSCCCGAFGENFEKLDAEFTFNNQFAQGLLKTGSFKDVDEGLITFAYACMKRKLIQPRSEAKEKLDSLRKDGLDLDENEVSGFLYDGAEMFE